MKPRDYQDAAIASIFEYFQNGGTGNPLVVMPTGVGKSIIIGGFIQQAFKAYPQTRILKLTHVKELLSQNMDKLLQLWPTAPAGVFSAGLKRKEAGLPIVFGGVGSVARMALESLGRIDLVLIDEAHLVSPKDSTMYQKVISGLQKANPHLKVIGLTATDYRLGSGKLTEEGGLFTDVCFDMSRLDSFNWFIEQGYLVPLIPKRPSIELDVSAVHLHGGEFKQNELQDAVDKDEITYAAVKEMLAHGSERQHWLIFASGIEHATHVSAMLDSLGVSSGVVHSKMADGQRDAAIADFKSGKFRAMVNNGILCLDQDTEILTDRGWVGMEEMDYLKNIASYHLDGKITFSPPKFVIKRDLSPEEFFVRGEGRTLGYRVTGNHRMLVRWQSASTFKVIPAEELIGAYRYRYPISGVAEVIGALDLTLSDCSFIGFWLGDGTLCKRGHRSGYGWECSLSQSEVYPFIIEWVDTVLLQCGLTHSRNGFNHSHGRGVRWTINRSCYKRMLHYLDKEGSPFLFNLSKIQFESLMYGFWLADGNHGQGDKAPPEGWAITGTQKTLYDKLQAIGVRCGYRISIKKKAKPKEAHYKQQYTLRWAKATTASLTKVNAPTRERSSEDKKAWCVTSDTGFIVSRRNGMVTVVGNTTGFDFPGIDMIGMLRPTQSPALWVQMLGRGTRPMYADGFDLSTIEGRRTAISSSQKRDCLVLDFAGNTKRLGPINDPVLPRKRGKGPAGTAPVRLCESCGTYCHASLRECPQCGVEFPREVKIREHAGTDALIADSAIKTDAMKVDRVVYAEHRKEGRPPSIQVSYFCGLRLFREWVCFEHPGFPGKKARDWWRMRSATRPPETVMEGLSRLNGVVTPTDIRVWIKPQYSEILAYSFDDGKTYRSN